MDFRFECFRTPAFSSAASLALGAVHDCTCVPLGWLTSSVEDLWTIKMAELFDSLETRPSWSSFSGVLVRAGSRESATCSCLLVIGEEVTLKFFCGFSISSGVATLSCWDHSGSGKGLLLARAREFELGLTAIGRLYFMKERLRTLDNPVAVLLTLESESWLSGCTIMCVVPSWSSTGSTKYVCLSPSPLTLIFPRL